MLDGVMQGEVAYRQLVLRGGGEKVARLPLLAPLNDLLGARRLVPNEPSDEDAMYGAYLFKRYDGLGFSRGWQGRAIDALAAFEQAAKTAPKGAMSAALAPHLERLRFRPDGGVADVPDLTVLATWSLLEAVRRQPLKLLT